MLNDCRGICETMDNQKKKGKDSKTPKHRSMMMMDALVMAVVPFAV